MICEITNLYQSIINTNTAAELAELGARLLNNAATLGVNSPTVKRWVAAGNVADQTRQAGRAALVASCRCCAEITVTPIIPELATTRHAETFCDHCADNLLSMMPRV